jgi:hypothetical protein
MQGLRELSGGGQRTGQVTRQGVQRGARCPQPPVVQRDEKCTRKERVAGYLSEITELPQVLLEIVEAYVDSRQEEIKNLMGENFVGPAEWKTFFGSDIDLGDSPPLPEKLTAELLNGPCPLDSKASVKDTHTLFLLPSTVNGRPYTMEALKESLLPNQKVSGRQYANFYHRGWYKTEAFYTTPASKSEWVLMLKHDVPDTKSRNYRYQEIVMGIHPSHRTTTALGRATGEMLHYLQTNVRLSQDKGTSCLCTSDRRSNGAVVHISFYGNGLTVYNRNPGFSSPHLGRSAAFSLS